MRNFRPWLASAAPHGTDELKKIRVKSGSGVVVHGGEQSIAQLEERNRRKYCRGDNARVEKTLHKVAEPPPEKVATRHCKCIARDVHSGMGQRRRRW